MTDKQIKTSQNPVIRERIEYGANIPAMQPIAKLPTPPNNGTSSGTSSSESGGQSSSASSKSN
jgi:hypothetical protein